MAKLNKQYYYTRNGEKKINCYHILLPKSIVKKAKINENDEIIIYESYGSIVIAKKWLCTCEECEYQWESGEPEDITTSCPKCHCGDIRFELNNGEN